MTDAAAEAKVPPAGQVKKDLYELGEIPPLGHVPKRMYAWLVRRERQGAPDTAMQVEVVDVPAIDSHEVLVMVMAAGVNYNRRSHTGNHPGLVALDGSRCGIGGFPNLWHTFDPHTVPVRRPT